MTTTIESGARVMWAARNGTVRYGTVLSWFEPTGTWFVEIDPDLTLPNGDGFRTWFKPADLIRLPDAITSEGA